MSNLFPDGRSIEEHIGDLYESAEDLTEGIESLGKAAYEEAKHPRGRGGKWVATFHGPVHGKGIPSVTVTHNGNPREMEEQIAKHIESITGKHYHEVDVDLASGKGKVGTRKPFRSYKETEISLRPVKPARTPAHPGGERGGPGDFGGGSGHVPGTGPKRLRPERLRGVAKAPEHPESTHVAGKIPRDRRSEGLVGPESKKLPNGDTRHVWKYEDFEGPDKTHTHPMAVDVSPKGEIKNAEKEHFGSHVSSGGRQFERAQGRDPSADRKSHYNPPPSKPSAPPLRGGMAGKSDAVIAHLAGQGHAAAKKELAHRVKAFEGPGYSARERRMRRERLGVKPGSKMSRRSGHDLLHEGILFADGRSAEEHLAEAGLPES